VIDLLYEWDGISGIWAHSIVLELSSIQQSALDLRAFLITCPGINVRIIHLAHVTAEGHM
jgi:hypothetical protein